MNIRLNAIHEICTVINSCPLKAKCILAEILKNKLALSFFQIMMPKEVSCHAAVRLPAFSQNPHSVLIFTAI